MPTINKRDFSGGWRPGDDPINGAPNGLLQMDNVDLDTNGALSLIGGTVVQGSAYANNLHSIYSRTMGGSRKIYSGDTAGNIFRDNTSIGSGGATDIAAFGTAFNYTLVCSGNTRKKDTGTGTPANLGVTAPTVAPGYVAGGRDVDSPNVTVASLVTNYVANVGAAAVITTNVYRGTAHALPSGNIKYLQVTADASGNAAIQTTGAAVVDSTVFYPGGVATDDDIFPFYGYTDNPYGASLQIDILLTAGNAFGDQIGDYFTYKIDDLSTAQFDSYTGVFCLNLKRSDFGKNGDGAKAWGTTYGIRITFKGTAGQVINYLGERPLPYVSYNGVGAYLGFFGGSKSQNGIYEFAQMNVNNTGSYVAKSPLGPSSGPISLSAAQANITLQVPADAQVNEVWVFARAAGGENEFGTSSVLDKWYRVYKQTASLGSSINVNTGDQEALTLNITYNQNLGTVASSGISDKILSIVGPINKRWYYFTTNMMYPSDLDNPDLVDTSIGIRTTGSNNEIFLWAKQVDKGTVLVGTSCDVYVLSGTFATLPDFTIDIFYHGLGCKYPPITYDADIWAGSVFYLANDGWRFITAGGQNELIVAPVLDKLYKGLTSNGYSAPNLKVAPGSVRFPVVIARNKLWCFVTGTNRCEVFDFTRKYWRSFNYSLGDVTAAFGTQDGQIIAFYSTDKKVREVDSTTTKLIDGATRQTIQLLWPIADGELPRNRKDSSVFKARIYTNGDSVSLFISNDLNQLANLGTLISSTTGQDKYKDLSTDTYVGLCKTYQVLLTGSVSDFLLEDWTIDFESRPNQVSYLNLLPQNFGNGSKKRVRNWPVVLDTLGNNVTWTPNVDGTATGATTTVNSSVKKTHNLFYTTDVFGVDYGGAFHCSTGLFEFFEMLPPNVVQILPIAKRFDQIGPEEFFKYGKIKQFEVRVLAEGTSLPYTIYFSDTQKRTGSITTTNGKEDSYFIDVPKGTNGRIARLVLGPTSFDFYRFLVRMQVESSGKDTELNWITIAND